MDSEPLISLPCRYAAPACAGRASRRQSPGADAGPAAPRAVPLLIQYGRIRQCTGIARGRDGS